MISAWLETHRRDVEEAPMWRAYRDTTDLGDRLRLLLAWVERRPTDPVRGLTAGRTADPFARRAAIEVGYLRGEFTAADLQPPSHRWTWREVADLALTQGEGWDSYRDEESCRTTFSRVKRGGYLDVPPARSVAEVASVLALLAGTERDGIRG